MPKTQTFHLSHSVNESWTYEKNRFFYVHTSHETALQYVLNYRHQIVSVTGSIVVLTKTAFIIYFKKKLLKFSYDMNIMFQRFD